jgi:hypothetical protein
MTEQNQKPSERREKRPAPGDEQDASLETERQIDDNQDDEGRDINDPSRVANDINKTGH